MTILGLSCFYHDAAAAIIVDGQIKAAAEEERFSRVKHDLNFPTRALEFCMQQSGIRNRDIDYVVFYEKPFLKFERLTLSFLATVPFSRGAFVSAYKTWLKDKLWIKAIIKSKLKSDSNKILFTHHHISHAASSYYSAPFSSAALLTCDGVGEWTTTAWGVAKENKLKLQQELKFPHSLGLLYSTFTQFLGFEVNEGEFKVMGLAPFGKPIYQKKVEKLLAQAKDGAFRLNLKYFNFQYSDKVSFSKQFVSLLGVPPVEAQKSDQVVGVYADIAASVQKVLEDKTLAIASYIQKQTGEENLCYAGGVALNGVANWNIFKNAGFKNIFVHPAAGDSGGAVGAALYVYYHVLNNPKKTTFSSPYLGRVNSLEEVEGFLKSHQIKAQMFTEKQLVKKVAELLVEQKVIGWVRGRFEWGPRALGARSILADPRDKKMKDLVNSKIKFREGFRPFAPVTIYEKGAEYFDVPTDFPPLLEYMLAVVPVRTKYRRSLGAITHVDGTARPQFIRKNLNPVYYQLIKEFGKKTGLSVLLNTSFNLKGEPIVNTCQEAYATFLKSGLDALVLENYLIEK